MPKQESAEVLSIEGREVRISNPDKLSFSRDVKLSKLDVVRYYLSVGWSAGAYGMGSAWAYTDVDGQYNIEGSVGGLSFGCESFGITAQATGYRPKFVQPERSGACPKSRRLISRLSRNSSSRFARCACCVLIACTSTSRDDAAPATDSTFAALQARGAEAMGVDQYTSSHVFESLADGGRIVLQRDSVDSAGTAAIRAHMRDIATRFTSGDFTIPGMVHAQEVPGTVVMAARRARIRYAADTLPRGGQVRITTTDPAAVAAVHAFLAFQRADHRASGHAR